VKFVGLVCNKHDNAQNVKFKNDMNYK